MRPDKTRRALASGLTRLFCVALCVLPISAHTDPIQSPTLGAASNFGQGWQPDMLDAARGLGVRDFRDAIYWRDIEQSDRSFDFDAPNRSYPGLLPGFSAGMSLTVNNGHPAYDRGHTPLSDDAVRAFAHFAARAVARFDAIHSVEVGNEMNSDRFVSGPGWDTDLKSRAVSYTALLAETARATRAVRPGIRILGGAAHSIPLAWFDALFQAGAAQYMDALVIHPYTVAPEQIARQIAQLRQLPDAAQIPIEVTEFGHTDPRIAPAHLLKSYCQMALAGVTRVVWYPLNARGDGLVPLIQPDGALSDAGRTFRLITEQLGNRTVRDAADDPFTYGCWFGSDRLVLWGMPRDLHIRDPHLSVLDATGAQQGHTGLALSEDRPLILMSNRGAIQPSLSFALSPQTVIADSLHQFAYPGDAPGDPFERLLRDGSDHAPLRTRPGQEKNGAPWVPYLGTPKDGVLRATADWVLPSHPENGPLDVVYRYHETVDRTVDVIVRIAPSDRSTDGVTLTVTRNGTALDQRHVDTPETVHISALSLMPGDTLDFIVGPGASARGDVTRFRVILRAAMR